MRSASVIFFVSVTITFGGCGLVFVPTVHEYPGVVKGVRVIDTDTHLPVSNPCVSFEIVKYENWIVIPPHADNTEEVAQTPATTVKKDEECVMLESTYKGGTFTFERKDMWGSVQIWLPLPTVLGPALFHEHRAGITVKAKGYRGILFSYTPRVPPHKDTKYATRENKGGCVFFDKAGVLIFYLKRNPHPAKPNIGD